MNMAIKPFCLRRCCGFFRKYGTQAASSEDIEVHEDKTFKQLVLDRDVETAIENKQYHPRKHPGVMRSKADHLPEYLVKAMKIVTEGQDVARLVAGGQALRQQLWGRLLPFEKSAIIQKIASEKEAVQSTLEEFDQHISDEKLDKLERKLAIKRLKELIHPWHPMSVTPETCLQYLVSRSPAEFCVLHKIFSEIRCRDPEFTPRSLFDFGSGLGTGFWAFTEVWNKPPNETFNVDINANMNELAYKILSTFKKKVSPAGGIYFRQFFPAKSEPTYDLVLSGFTLLELPTLKTRMESIAKLWSKVENYLVIVEDGTIAGYKAVMEARNLILHLENQTTSTATKTNAHVFSPCPHDYDCPLQEKFKHPCNFELSYMTPGFLENRQIRRNHCYSYVVLKKGHRPPQDAQWPRCLKESSKGKKFVRLELCTSKGDVIDAPLSKSCNCSNSYKCAKKTRSGDLLPGQIVEIPKNTVTK